MFIFIKFITNSIPSRSFGNIHPVLGKNPRPSASVRSTPSATPVRISVKIHIFITRWNFEKIIHLPGLNPGDYKSNQINHPGQHFCPNDIPLRVYRGTQDMGWKCPTISFIARCFWAKYLCLVIFSAGSWTVFAFLLFFITVAHFRKNLKVSLL